MDAIETRTVEQDGHIYRIRIHADSDAPNPLKDWDEMGTILSLNRRHSNFDPAGVPGNPVWHLAPREMGWEGKTLGEICAQIKDPARNGGRKVEDLIHHIGDDTLVGWAWAPGYGRQTAPGSQKQAGALVAAWVQTGAVCPEK